MQWKAFTPGEPARALGYVEKGTLCAAIQLNRREIGTQSITLFFVCAWRLSFREPAAMRGPVVCAPRLRCAEPAAMRIGILTRL